MKKSSSRPDALAVARLAELRESFRQCDSNQDGYIGFEEFVALLEDLESGMSERDAKIGFQAVDTDDDQRIDFREFAAWWNER